MMRSIILLLLLISSPAFAQVRLKLNYNKQWQLTTSDSAAYIRVCIYDTTNAFFAGQLSDLYPSGKPQMTGMYKYKRKAGEFTFYYENGQIESKGIFENDLRAGVWRYYYPDGKLRREIEFFSNGDQPKVITLNDVDGTPLIQNGTGDWSEVVETPAETTVITGHYKNYKRDGKWTHETNGIKLRQWYQDGKITKEDVSSSLFGAGGYDRSLSLPWKFILTEVFDATPEVTFEMYPVLKWMTVDGYVQRKPDPGTTHETSNDSGDKVYMVVEQMPEFPGGIAAMVKFIDKNLMYPKEARKNGVEGSVFVEFVVKGDGKLTDFKVIKEIGSGCDEEALRVMMLMGDEIRWKPGKQQGKPVDVRFVLPIKFKRER
ncbi:MAG: TonB family protein [Bacteroidota bacterium]